MPRLLLVDDNPSIHKIAETLLASTHVELVCVDSAEKALDLIGKGERFDVALLDTALTGMDGWQLLEKLRQNPLTQRIPIALMAGVLDAVDPERLSQAPIQGFIKKPVELRDLGERVQRLLEIPVPLAELPPEAPVSEMPPQKELSPFATMPATKLSELPEIRSATSEMPLQAESHGEAAPEELDAIHEFPEESEALSPISSMKLDLEDDLLLLTEEDLYPVEAPVAAPAPVVEEAITLEEMPLELEELDIESLKGLAIDPSPEAETLPSFRAPAPETPQAEEWGVEAAELPDLGPAVEFSTAPDVASLAAPEEAVSQPVAALSQEQEVENEPIHEEWVAPPPPPPPSAAVAIQEPAIEEEEEDLDLTPLPYFEAVEPSRKPETKETADIESPTLVPMASPPELPTVAPVAMTSPEAPVAMAVPEVPLAAPEALPASQDSTTLNRQAILDVILSDPALLDALAKAVVTRLGDQALREVAWEVMPELAERMGRAAGL